MTSRKASKRLALPMGIAAFTLSVAGALTPASAAGADWVFYSGADNLKCLHGSTASDRVWVEECGSGAGPLWHWGTESNQWDGHTMKRLVSNANGGCLTTDSGSASNDVYAAPCGNGRSGQFWTADGKYLQNQNHSYLSFSGSGAAVYTVTTLNDDTCKWFDYVV
ncbi:hypothetical protein ACIQPR_34425 [Streptomyces sp. NPDC091280]|uniref:hypothetical protein n=1 Tax=unclassified Streptomyces TaxID=2593676 RepID=UPI00381D9D15